MYFYGKSKEDIGKVRDAYFVENPEAKAEYDAMYPDVITTGTGNNKKRDEHVPGEDSGMWPYFGEHFYRQSHICVDFDGNYFSDTMLSTILFVF